MTPKEVQPITCVYSRTGTISTTSHTNGGCKSILAYMVQSTSNLPMLMLITRMSLVLYATCLIGQLSSWSQPRGTVLRPGRRSVMDIWCLMRNHMTKPNLCAWIGTRGSIPYSGANTNGALLYHVKAKFVALTLIVLLSAKSKSSTVWCAQSKCDNNT